MRVAMLVVLERVLLGYSGIATFGLNYEYNKIPKITRSRQLYFCELQSEEVQNSPEFHGNSVQKTAM